MRIAGPAVNDALLARTPDLKHLYELSLDISNITVSGFESIARMPSLGYLQIGGRHLTEADVDVLAGMTRLERLDICGAGLTDAGLAKLIQLPNLNSIMLYNNPITKASLEKLEQLPHLTSLDIRSTQIEEDSIPALARFTNLKHLDIDINNNFSNKSRQQLRAALPNCEITLHTPDRPRMATPFVESKKRTWSNLEAPKISTQTSFTLNTSQRHYEDDD
jgi:Leucine-rich repeat (LRR) protein